MFGSLIKFPGVDGRSIAVDKHHVYYLEGSAVAGEPVTNIHMSNGRWVTARGTIDEVAAVLADTKAQDEERSLEGHRREARARRQARAEVDAVMRAINYRPEVKEWGVEGLPDGRRKVTAYLEPVAIPDTGPCFNCGEEGSRVQFHEDRGALWCGKCDVDPIDMDRLPS